MARPPVVPSASIVVATLLVAAGACFRNDAPPPPGGSGPYVVVAVDNHFHDIHPEDRKEIAAGRGLIVRNEGRNLHNFTIVGTEVSPDIEAGRSHSWRRIGDVLRPGTYRVICRYHDWDGMTGRFTVVP